MKPVISVICCTYNHEAYIRSTLESILQQKTCFDFEVIVRDDASTDRTSEIVEELSALYPDKLVYIREPENMFSKGIKPFQSALPRAKGRYVAVCEGDDFWVTSDKLQTQFDILEANSSIDLCFHPAIEYRNERPYRTICNYFPKDSIIPLDQVIKMRGGGMPTASLLIRRSSLEPLPDWFLTLAPVGDSFLQALGSAKGGAYYSPKLMSAYRKYTSGSRTMDSATRIYTEQELISKIEGYEESYRGLDTITSYSASHAVSEAVIDELCHVAVMAVLSSQNKAYTRALDKLTLRQIGLNPKRAVLYFCKKFPILQPPLKHVIKLLLRRHVA